GAATIMHIPVIVAGILEGPVVGAFVGLLFGLFTLPIFGDPRVVIPARLVIGGGAWLAFRAARFLLKNRVSDRAVYALAGGFAGLIGTVINTIGTLSLAVVFGYFPIRGPEGAVAIGVFHGTPEALVATVVVAGLAAILSKRLARRR
ncbi:MAG TPA: ECF transporter S component, partial [Bacillota bacterium]|nr:ECF transporter S component [Bacillota bacterium]